MTSDASIHWPNGAPYCTRFHDIYFNPDNGLEETRHVFLNGNRLAERFVGCDRFTIAELGFGTGLNCLAAWELFLRTAPPHAQLHYLAFERFPLPFTAMQQAAAQWPELVPLAQALGLPPLSRPFHRLHAPRLSLTLVIGDARQTLPSMAFKADAWFLDGFAPAKNPEMWEDRLLRAVGERTRPGGTAATFTVAGSVRRGLQAAGFAVEKAPGFGRKREMTVASRTSGTESEMARRSRGMTALVIGGGIAGCSAAAALARRGYHVTLLEAGGIASGASGNPAGALYPRLSAQWSPAMRFYWDALHYMQGLFDSSPESSQTILGRSSRPGIFAGNHSGNDIFTSCGMLKLPISPEEETKLRTLPQRLGLPAEQMQWLTPEAASERAGMALKTGALWLPGAGLISGPAFCDALLASCPTLIIKPHRAVERLEPTRQGWRVACADGSHHEAPIVILATAAAMRDWSPAAHLPLRWDRGQLTIAPALKSPCCILSHKGYALPLERGRVLLGATHGRGDTDTTCSDADDAENLALTRRFLPGLLAEDAPVAGSRAALRCNAPDHMPIVGELAAGLYVSTGHGSRGLLSAPYAAEILADLIDGTPPPVSQEVLEALSPQRF